MTVRLAAHGLKRLGHNLYQATNDSGDAAVGQPGTGTRGSLISFALENSNVDLEDEFVDMIHSQRTYQANARVISTADGLLEELVKLLIVEGVNHRESLALVGIVDRGDRQTALRGKSERVVQGFLYLEVRHHLPRRLRAGVLRQLPAHLLQEQVCVALHGEHPQGGEEDRGDAGVHVVAVAAAGPADGPLVVESAFGLQRPKCRETSFAPGWRETARGAGGGDRQSGGHRSLCRCGRYPGPGTEPRRPGRICLAAGSAAGQGVPGRLRNPSVAAGGGSQRGRRAGRRGRIPGRDVMGKTGTAQVISLQGRLAAGDTARDFRDHGWFVFAVPAGAPELAGVVFGEHNEHGYLSAPIAKHMMETYFAKQEGRPRPVLVEPEQPDLGGLVEAANQ